MHAERRSESHGSKSERRQRCRPRVVIFNISDTPRVEVLELPESANLGHRICHHGRVWRVTGIRTGDRVLIAELEAN